MYCAHVTGTVVYDTQNMTDIHTLRNAGWMLERSAFTSNTTSAVLMNCAANAFATVRSADCGTRMVQEQKRFQQQENTLSNARRRTHPELQSSNGYMRRSQSTVTRDVQIRQACARISTTIANRVMLTNATRKHNDTCSTMLTIATAIAAPAVRACAAPYLRRN